MGALLLGIDIGTFSSKAALVTQAGEVLRTAVVPHGIATPVPGHVEQDADAVWWHDLCALCKQSSTARLTGQRCGGRRSKRNRPVSAAAG